MPHGRAEERPAIDSSALSTAALALARRFAAGGTLWCRAPGADSHAQHVAVEFVHPVVVGSRALPAVAVIGDANAATATLRAASRAGDALLVVAADDARIRLLLRRASAWGLTSIWLGAGPIRPIDAPADHLVWLGDDPLGRHDGLFVLAYHLLWELTHVCFGHPGLLREATAASAADAACITCSDDARLAEVAHAGDRVAVVRTACGQETVSTALVGDVRPGDLVLVHAGTAITRVES